MRNNISPSAGATIVDKLKVYEGGTGVTDAASARAALGALAQSDYNQPNGLAQLDTSGLLAPSVFPDDGPSPISVQGPASAVVNLTVQYLLTNYDIFTTYTIVPIVGSITRIGSAIYYTAPSSAGAGGFVINGRTINVTIAGVQPVTPTLSVNGNGGTSSNVTMNGATTTFAMNTTSTATHLNSDWQVATDAAFTNIVAQSLADTVNKIAWGAGGLNTSTTYYMRVRHRDSNNGVSGWSNAATITTQATFFVQREEARIVCPTPVGATNWFGMSVTVDGTATRMAVAAYNNAQTAGKIYIFIRSGSTWTLETSFTNAGGDTNFGQQGMSMSSDGSKLITASSFNCYLYTRSGTTWTVQASPLGSWTGNNYDCVTISADGTRMAGSCHGSSGDSFLGVVRVYLVSATSFTFEATMPNPQGTNTSWLGYRLALNSDGTYLMSHSGNSGSGGSCGAYIFLRTGTTWTYQAYLDNGAGTGTSNAATGDISAAGDRVVIGLIDASSAMNMVIYKRTGTAWAVEQTIVRVAGNVAIIPGSIATMNGNGDQILFGAGINASASTPVYVFTRSGTTWTQQTSLTYSVPVETGAQMALAKDGTRLVSAQRNATIAGQTNSGVAYVHSS